MGRGNKFRRVAFCVPIIALTVTACGSGKKTTGFGDDTSGGSSGGASGGGDDGGSISLAGDSGFGSPFDLDAEVPTAPPVGDAGCATAMSQAHASAVYLLFVLDGSGSMSMQNKWTAVVPALKDLFTQMQAEADPGVGAGLIVFSDSMDSTLSLGPYPSSADVPIAFVDSTHSGALTARLGGNPALLTPTQAAMTGGYTELENFKPTAPLSAGGKKVLVLITDGAPTDCVTTGGNYGQNACVIMAGQKLKGAAPQGPIETFVVGVGDFPSTNTGSFDPSFLGYAAQAGGTGPANCNPSENTTTSDLCYFEIDPSKSATAQQLQQQFEMALNTIRGEVVSCEFPIQSSGIGTFDKTRVNVEVGGKTILEDPNNGWTYDNVNMPTKIILHGAACTQAKGNISEKVNVVLGCPTMAVPQ